MKKVLSLVMVIAMVLSSMTFAFATTFEDVTNETQSEAISALVSLGIVDGYEDGTYRPEKTITRAQMAKLIIVALGYESIANDTPSFKDCQKHWAKGYISLASDLGIVNGKGNGIFDPDSTVKYQEAAVMLLRALGYNDKAINGGRSESYNASNYKTTALKLNLFDDVTLSNFSSGANRGDVAVMLFNNLTNAMVEINPTTGLAQKVVKSQNNNSVVYETLISKLAVRKEMTVTIADLAKDYTTDLAPYLFETVVAYLMGDDVVYVEKSNNKTVNGAVESMTTTGTIKLTIDDVEYIVPVVDGKLNINLAVNGKLETLTAAQLKAITDGTHSVKVIYTEGSSVNTVTGLSIEKVDYTKKVANEYIAGKTRFEGFNLPVDKKGKVDLSKVTVLGDATSMNDIQKNDIIEVVLTKNSDKVEEVKIYVTRNTVEGKINKVSGSKYFVDGVEYKVASTLVVGSDALGLGKSGVFYLNRAGVVVSFAEGEQDINYNYAIITGVADGSVKTDAFDSSKKAISTYPKVKVVEMDGTVKVYELAVAINNDGTVKTAVTGFNIVDNTLATTLAANTGVVNTNDHVVEFAVNEDGRITEVKAVSVTNNATGTKVKVDSPNFLANENTKVLNLTSKGYSVTSLDKLEKEVNYYSVGNKFSWNLLIVVNGAIKTNTDKIYGVITETSNVLDGSDEVQEIKVLINGEVVTYITNSKNTVASDKLNKVVSLVVDVNNVVTGFDSDALRQLGTTTTVSAINGNRIALTSDGVSYAVSDDVVVYTQANDNTVSVGDMADVQFAIGETNTVSLFDKNNDGYVDTIFLSK